MSADHGITRPAEALQARVRAAQAAEVTLAEMADERFERVKEELRRGRINWPGEKVRGLQWTQRTLAAHLGIEQPRVSKALKRAAAELLEEGR